MTSFDFEPRTVLINSPLDFPLNFFMNVNGRLNLLETDDTFNATTKTLITEGPTYSPDADGTSPDIDGAGPGTAVAIADVDSMNITGFKSYVRGQVNKVTKLRGINGQKQRSTLTFVLNTPDVGAQVAVRILFNSWDDKAEFAGHSSEFSASRVAILDISQGETATTFAQKLVKSFSSTGLREARYFPLTVTAVAGVVTFESLDEATSFGITVTGITETLTGNSAINQVAAGKVAGTVSVTIPYFGGRGNYANMRMMRPETPANVYNYSVGPNSRQIPIRGVLYTRFNVVETIPVPQSTPTTKTRVVESTLWINESLSQAYINAIVAYFNSAATVKVDYPATTVAVAIITEVPAATLSVN